MTYQELEEYIKLISYKQGYELSLHKFGENRQKDYFQIKIQLLAPEFTPYEYYNNSKEELQYVPFYDPERNSLIECTTIGSDELSRYNMQVISKLFFSLFSNLENKKIQLNLSKHLKIPYGFTTTYKPDGIITKEPKYL